jgi:hypothetical protein
MACNWLASMESPSVFCFMLHIEQLKYLIIFLSAWKMVLSLLLLNWLKNLFEPFGPAVVQCEHQGDKILKKFDSQSFPMIAIG